MTARHYVVDATGSMIEVTDRVREIGWQAQENAEEGATAISTFVLDDPDFDLDLVGLRHYLIKEDASTGTDDVLFSGYVADQTVGHFGLPLERKWSLSVSDSNFLWLRRVMVGSDCKRPAESDVARMQWLMSTAEASWVDNATDFLYTGSPVNMDAVDYRGQMFSAVADDCAQASGKNWFCFYRYNGSAYELTVWYGKDSQTGYTADVWLSNDLADIDDAQCFAISADTKIVRDPSRVYSAVYLPYDGGAVYRANATTAANFMYRDFVAPSLNVKSKAKANARALRYLADLDTQDERITTAIKLPMALATRIRAGMRVPFRATHLPGYDTDFQWCRVLSCSVEPKGVGDRYALTLELSKSTGDAPGPPLCDMAVVDDFNRVVPDGLDTASGGGGWATAYNGSGPPAGSVDGSSAVATLLFNDHGLNTFDAQLDGWSVVSAPGTFPAGGRIRFKIDPAGDHLSEMTLWFVVNGYAVARSFVEGDAPPAQSNIQVLGGSVSSDLTIVDFPLAGIWYWLAVEASSTSVMAKTWEDGTTEPDWMVVIADAVPPGVSTYSVSIEYSTQVTLDTISIDQILTPVCVVGP